MRVRIGNRFGKIIAEVIPGIGPITWTLNGIGKMTLTLATSNSKATETNLQIGNRIYVEFENGLSPWGGIIGLPRTWSGGIISVACYGIEHLLKYRCTEKNHSFYGQPVGAIFQELLLREEQQDPLGIVLGSIWLGGNLHWPRYHYKSLWYVLDYSMRKMERCDYRFVPYLEDNHIKFRADFAQELGTNKITKVSLVEGRNIAAGLQLEEQGAVINAHYAVAEGATWGTERLVIPAKDLESIAKYGLRETGRVYAGTSVPSTLEMYARNELTTNSEPRKIFTLPVTNHEPGMFASYDLGDTIKCVLSSFGFNGFDGDVRVIERTFNPNMSSCDLVVEVPNTPTYWIYSEDVDET